MVVYGCIWRVLCHIIMHGNTNVLLVIVPSKIHTAVDAAGPVDIVIIVGLYGSNKVFCVSFGEVFDTKGIDAESERCFSLSMFSNSGGVR